MWPLGSSFCFPYFGLRRNKLKTQNQKGKWARFQLPPLGKDGHKKEEKKNTIVMGAADERVLKWIYINICECCQWKNVSESAHSFFQLLVKILGHLIERARATGLVHLSCRDWQPVHHVRKAPHWTSIMYPKWSTPLSIYRLQEIKHIRRIINS